MVGSLTKKAEEELKRKVLGQGAINVLASVNADIQCAEENGLLLQEHIARHNRQLLLNLLLPH